jgi:hypothetical protein
MTYKQFADFVRKYENDRSQFKKRWFKVNLHTGVVYICEHHIGLNEKDWVWVYDRYFPCYKEGVFVGVGNYDGVVGYPLDPITPIRMDEVGVEMVILTDIYGDLDVGGEK